MKVNINEADKAFAQTATLIQLHNAMRAAERRCEANQAPAYIQPPEYDQWLAEARYYRAAIYLRFPDFGAREMRCAEWMLARCCKYGSPAYHAADKILGKPLEDYETQVREIANDLLRKVFESENA